jgi:hypothetical protein
MEDLYGKLLENLFKESIDKVAKEFVERQDDFVFKKRDERFGLFFPILKNQSKNWKKPKNCIYLGCKNKSVVKSHTLTKNVFLSSVAENGKVYRPSQDIKAGKLKIEKVGISEASTFPGFCPRHEDIFNEFERKRKIETSSEILKQVYRTICREVVVKEHKIESYKKFLNTYLEYRDKKLNEELLMQPFIKLMKQRGVEFQSLKFNGADYLKKYLERDIKNIEYDLKEFKKLFYNKLHDELEDKSVYEYFWGYNIHVAQHIPLALSGRGSFLVSTESKKQRRIELILNVLPFEGNTLISIFSLKSDETNVMAYLGYYLSQDFGVINMIESWMVHGSDHWFLSPSVWEKITKKNQIRIADEITDLRFNVGNPFSMTIFNQLKRDNLDQIKSKMTDVEFRAFLEKEASKFTD